ncbi:hypothetical protein ACWEO4_47640 [Streptomyces sp. NPDC004393]|uniref:hypothetical protein n=1 Tax=Streptomyces sp. NPDC004533 TaxID=3154278 RepID=UPI0033BEBF66
MEPPFLIERQDVQKPYRECFPAGLLGLLTAVVEGNASRLIITDGDKHFDELTLTTPDGPRKLTVTYEHPFWSPSAHQDVPGPLCAIALWGAAVSGAVLSDMVSLCARAWF